MFKALQKPLFTYRLRYPAAKMTEYGKELIAYKKLLKQYRKRNIQNYWEFQTKVENEFIDNFLESQKQLAERKAVRNKTQLVNFVFEDNERRKKQDEVDQIRKAKLNDIRQYEDIKKLNRQEILKVLKRESQFWFNENNLEDTLISQVIYPDQVLDETEYYLNLQEQALLLESGQYDELNDLANETTQLQHKNKLSTIYFKKVLQIIKFLQTQNEFHELKKEWKLSRQVIFNDDYLEINPDQKLEQLKQVDLAFQSLIVDKIEEYEKNPKKKLQFLENQLVKLYNLIKNWQKYVGVLKMSPSVVSNIVQGMDSQQDLFKQENPYQNAYLNQKGKIVNQDGYLSTEEKHTDDDEEAFMDIEEAIKKRKQAQEQRERELQQKMHEEQENLKHDEQNYESIEGLLKMAEQDVQEASESFEEKFSKAMGLYMYEEVDESKLKSVKSFLQGVNLETLFPEDAIENQLKFTDPNMDYQNFNEIIKHEVEQSLIKERIYQKAQELQTDHLFRDPKSKKIETMLMVEVYKEQLDGLKQLDQEERELAEKCRSLLNLIGEQTIDEPQILVSLWNYHQA